MSETPTPGPAIECVECGEISAVIERECHNGFECPQCGSDLTTAADIIACDGEGCEAEDHDFGLGACVVQRA